MERDIQDPVQRIFNRPVGSDSIHHQSCLTGETTDEESIFGGGLTLIAPLTLHHNNCLKSCPSGRLGQIAQVRKRPIAAGFDPSMPDVDELGKTVGDPLKLRRLQGGFIVNIKNEDGLINISNGSAHDPHRTIKDDSRPSWQTR